MTGAAGLHPMGLVDPHGACGFLSESDRKPSGVLKERAYVFWLPFQMVTLAVVLRMECTKARADVGRPVTSCCNNAGKK